jgi:manganese/zinc/iron transport system substrate-binding protein
MHKLICSIMIAIFLMVGCDSKNSSKPKEAKKLYIVTTTGMITDAVANIGGECIIVHGLMGPGVDPHLKKVTASDTKSLAKADIIIYNGLHLEGKMIDTFEKMKHQKKAVYAVTEDIAKDRLRKQPELADAYDPHIWFDVSLWKEAVRKIEKILVTHDPQHAPLYQKNAEAYYKKLDELHAWVHKEIAQIPKQGRVLVTAHDAFGYFGLAYGVEVVGLQGISTAAEYGVKDVETIVDMLVKRKIKAVFVESSVPKKNMDAVVEGCRAQKHTVVVGGLLFSDAMGEAGTPEGTYIGMVRHNIKTIVGALGK